MIVVGSAKCLYDDVERALKLRPLASLFLVNGACTAIENAEHVLAGHEEKAEEFAAARRAKFPSAQWRLHACTFPHRLALMRKMAPSVTDWHGQEMGVAATSASKAAKIAMAALGATEVILAGCPMNGGGYFEGEAVVHHEASCQRIGSDDITPPRGRIITPPHHGEYSTAPGAPMLVQEAKIIRLYRARLKELAQGEFKGKVFSMSGFTREQLGQPKEL